MVRELDEIHGMINNGRGAQLEMSDRKSRDSGLFCPLQTDYGREERRGRISM